MLQRSFHVVVVTLAAFIAAYVCPFSHAANAESDQTFARLFGTWSGAGQAAMKGGAVERLQCRAYYTSKGEGGSMGLALRCASPSNSIEIRASLKSAGREISGVWEERNFNVAGEVRGTADQGRLDLAIRGGGFSGSMLVTMDGADQKVSIRADGIDVKTIDVSFSRSGPLLRAQR